MPKAAYAVFAVAVAALVPSVLAADTLPCAARLTAEEVKAATGLAFEDMGPEQRDSGQSECAWMSRGKGGFKSVAFTFWTKEGVQAALVPAESLAAFYDMNLQSTQEVAGTKGDALPGIGVRAALVQAGEQLVAYVEMADGMAHVVANGLTRAQVTAIAKAIAGPPAASGGKPSAGKAPESLRVAGPSALQHPVGALAVEYARLLHGAKADTSKVLSAAARKHRASLPASERAESDAYLRRTIPAADVLEATIRESGMLVVEGSEATLSIMTSESRTNADGSVTASTTTMNMAFELEDGSWKVAK